jgi:hypothetical protein
VSPADQKQKWIAPVWGLARLSAEPYQDDALPVPAQNMVSFGADIGGVSHILVAICIEFNAFAGRITRAESTVQSPLHAARPVTVN